MNAPERSEEQLLDLLIKEATEGLTPAETAELQQLSKLFPQTGESTPEQTIASLSVALLSGSEAPPQALRDRILAQAPKGALASNVSDLSEVRSRVKPGSSTAARFNAAGWWVAAASLLLAVAGWWPRLTNETGPMMASSPAEEREELLASGHAIRASWSPPAANGEPLVGDVVFDPMTQRGFLSFKGIPANDPRLAQYQLWIVDARRKQPEPVDGGIFNVTTSSAAAGEQENGEIVIPFEARLPVGQPAAFVVTLEQPGGVVISKQERVLALAKVGT